MSSVMPEGYKWAKRFLRLAYEVAGWSKDTSTKVGAIAVGKARQLVAEGYNGLPRGVRDLPERFVRPDKYAYTVHAEANLVAHAARSVLEGSTVYCTHLCCAQCAGLLINAGVARIVYDSNTFTNMDPKLFEIAQTMFREAGVALIAVSDVRTAKEIANVLSED
jgi:dCMP deaminase